jgi:GABA permease
MRRYLIVANQTLLGEPLLGRVRECIAAGPCSFHLVVPATHAPGPSWQLEHRDHAYAAERLQQGLERFRALGIAVEGEVGDARVMDAVRDAIRNAGPFNEIILSTLPAGVSRWLHQDLPHRIHRWFELPVSTVIAQRVAA